METNKLPLVSVVIPTFKRKNTKKAVDSVLKQNYPKLEIIVVDDNAEFEDYRIYVEKMLSDYIKDGKVKLIQNSKNLGGALSRNVGIYASNGEYITFLDDDDWYLQGKISKQVELLKKSDYALVYCWSKGLDKNGNLLWENKKSLEGNLLVEAMTDCIANTSLIMCKREALFNVGLFEDTPCKQDVLLELKLAVAGYSFGCIKEMLVIYGNSDISYNRISNVSSKTLLGFANVREYARKNYRMLTKKQMKFVEGDTAYKMCGIAKKIDDRVTYRKEMLTALKNLNDIRKIIRIIYDYFMWK